MEIGGSKRRAKTSVSLTLINLFDLLHMCLQVYWRPTWGPLIKNISAHVILLDSFGKVWRRYGTWIKFVVFDENFWWWIPRVGAVHFNIAKNSWICWSCFPYNFSVIFVDEFWFVSVWDLLDFNIWVLVHGKCYRILTIPKIWKIDRPTHL